MRKKGDNSVEKLLKTELVTSEICLLCIKSVEFFSPVYNIETVFETRK